MNFSELMSTVESLTSIELIHLLMKLRVIKGLVTCLRCGEACCFTQYEHLGLGILKNFLNYSSVNKCSRLHLVFSFFFCNFFFIFPFFIFLIVNYVNCC